jgi:hypothetical protein
MNLELEIWSWNMVMDLKHGLETWSLLKYNTYEGIKKIDWNIEI